MTACWRARHQVQSTGWGVAVHFAQQSSCGLPNRQDSRHTSQSSLRNKLFQKAAKSVQRKYEQNEAYYEESKKLRPYDAESGPTIEN